MQALTHVVSGVKRDVVVGLVVPEKHHAVRIGGSASSLRTARRRPVREISPPDGRSRPPARCNRVGFPLPGGRRMALQSPRSTVKSTPAGALTGASPSLSCFQSRAPCRIATSDSVWACGYYGLYISWHQCGSAGITVHIIHQFASTVKSTLSPVCSERYPCQLSW